MTASVLVQPALVLIVGGLLLPLLKGRLRGALIVIAPLVALALAWQVPDGEALRISYLGFALTPVRGDALSRLFAVTFAAMAFAGGVFALNQKRSVELAAAYCYAGSAIGAAFAGDLITLFIFWEAMAIASTLIVWSAGTTARGAGMRYAIIHLLGGVLLMAGIAGEIAASGTTAFQPLALDSVPRWLILSAFLLNAGTPPLSAWLPDAYPEASWSGMVFLSAFTTKAAIYVLIRGFAGTELLIPVGLFMACYGIVYAALENDMRRLLAYSLVNQIGFMIVGIGIGTEMALNGAATHAVASVFYQALLIMTAGAVLFVTGKRRFTDIGGLARTMPLTAACCVVGALSIASFPLASGFISKTMISEAAGQEGLAIVWYLLAAASAGVVLHAGMRYPWLAFFGKEQTPPSTDPPWSMRIAMLLLAALSIGIGVAPQYLYALLPYPVDYTPYTGAHVVFYVQLLLFAALAFVLMRRWLPPAEAITLDIDWLYRRLGPAVAAAGLRAADRISGRIAESARQAASASVKAIEALHGPGGILARTWPTGRMAFWATVMLGAYLILFYL